MSNPNHRTNKSFDAETPAALSRIADAVSHLMVPNLAPLAGAVVEIQAGLNDKRRELLNEMEEVKQNAWDAATRLMLPSDAAVIEAPKTYFEHVKHLEGNQS